MSGFAARTNVNALVEALDWANTSTVVDVGGGWAPVSISLAQRFRQPVFVVQDLEHVVEDGPSHVPDELTDRVRFVAHDIFTEQDIKSADVYLLRHVLHNFPDDGCKDILKAQIPGRNTEYYLYLIIVANGLCMIALKHGAHIVIQDAVVPEPRNELPAYKEKFRR